MLLRSFASKLSLYIMSSVVLIFMIVLVYNYNISKNVLLDDIEKDTVDLVNSILYNVGSIFSSTEHIPKILSFMQEHGNFTDAELLNIIKHLVSSTPEIYGSAISFEPMYNDRNSLYGPYYYKAKDGLKYVDISKNYDYQKSDWYTVTKKLETGVWNEPYYDKGGGETLMVTYSQPCYKDINGKRTFIGVATADVSINWLLEYFDKLNLPGTGYAFLISANGTVIAHKSNSYEMKETVFSLAEKRKNDSLKKFWGKMAKGETGFVKYFSETLKKQCYLRYAPFVIKGWSMGIVVPEEELFYDLKVVTTKLFIMGFGGYVLTLILIVILAHKITMPLRNLADATKKIGKGDFQTKIPEISSADEIGVLSRSFRTMQASLIKYIANLQETTAAKEKIEKDISVAREIQQNLLPHKFPNVKQFDLFATLIPAREIGGDLYDFFFVDEKHLCFAIGDVSGKGVSAALFMAVTKTLLRAKISTTMDPAKVLGAMNEDLCKENDSSMFVTFFLGILNIETGLLEYCNAGHTPPLIHTANRGFYYFHTEVPHLPLGIAANVNYSGNELKLLPEDIFFLYTDGVTEAMNINDVQFSEEKLLDVLAKNKDETVLKIINNVKATVEQHVSGAIQSDDITMLIIKYNG